MKTFRSDEAFLNIINAAAQIENSQTALQQISDFLRETFDFTSAQAQRAAENIAGSIHYGNELLNTKKRIQGIWQFSVNKGTVASGWSSKLFEYQFKGDFTYTYVYRYRSGRAPLPNPMIPSGAGGIYTPNDERQDGVFIPGKSIANFRITLCSVDGKVSELLVQAGQNDHELQIDGKSFNKTWSPLK